MESVILSLTSYGKRVQSVSKVVDSLKNQKADVDKVILWLDKDEFSNGNLPRELLLLQDEIFEIKFTNNTKSYKKLIPALNDYPQSVIITFDDDIVIPDDVVGKMLSAHKLHPNAIIANRGRIITLNSGEFCNYNDWPVVKNDHKLFSNGCIMPIGFGGVLYPAGALCRHVTDCDLFLNIADNADDIWFKFMSLLKGTSVVLLPREVTSSYMNLDGTQDVALISTVNSGNRNIAVANEICDHFHEIKAIVTSNEFDLVTMQSSAYLDFQVRPKLFETSNEAVTFFRKTSDRVSEFDRPLAKKLIEMALRYRPNGKFLKKKKQQYEKEL
ncbi:hypothetical protein ACPV5S_19465 [Vibrio astriarenae]